MRRRHTVYAEAGHSLCASAVHVHAACKRVLTSSQRINNVCRYRDAHEAAAMRSARAPPRYDLPAMRMHAITARGHDCRRYRPPQPPRVLQDDYVASAL